MGFIREAFRVNGELSDAAFHSPRCVITAALLRSNGGVRISDNAEKSALVLAASAAEARVLGLNYPAMSITGSGNHGIISTMPAPRWTGSTASSEHHRNRPCGISDILRIPAWL